MWLHWEEEGMWWGIREGFLEEAIAVETCFLFDRIMSRFQFFSGASVQSSVRSTDPALGPLNSVSL